eukprot:10144964-Alexandrium_andersonii.AAC.1
MSASLVGSEMCIRDRFVRARVGARVRARVWASALAKAAEACPTLELLDMTGNAMSAGDRVTLQGTGKLNLRVAGPRLQAADKETRDARRRSTRDNVEVAAACVVMTTSRMGPRDTGAVAQAADLP